MYKLGVIGAGNMAEAIITGILKAKLYSPKDIIISDISSSRIEKLHDSLGVDVTEDNKKVVKESELIILAVKPQAFETVFDKEFGMLFANKILISIMAGVTLKSLSKRFAKTCVTARVMPNTPALVQSGISSVCYNSIAANQHKEKVEEILECIGEFQVIDEALFPATTAVSGCSPAFVFMMIEAMADSAVSLGLTRDAAYHMAAAAIKGSADLYLATKEHPAKLKDIVCSPSGATIEGVKVLEKEGFRFALMDAVQACSDRAVELGNSE